MSLTSYPTQSHANRPRGDALGGVRLSRCLQAMASLSSDYGFAVRMDAEPRLIWLTRSAVHHLGLSVGQRAEAVWETLAGEDKSRVQRAVRSLRTSSNARVSLTVPTERGPRHLDVHLRLEEEQGERTLYGAARDVTRERLDAEEQLRLEAQLRHAQKLESVGQLAAGIAHEINTPTQFAGDNVLFVRESLKELQEMLARWRPALEQIAAPDELESFDELWGELPVALAESMEGLGQIGRIVGAMKQFSHPGAGRPMVVDPNEIVRSALTVATHELKYTATVETELGEGLPGLTCFPGEMGQVVLNLLVNAAHAVRERHGAGCMGQVVVRTRQGAPGWVRFEVQDNGSGIPETLRERVFEPFFTTKPPGKGTGQGLSLAWAVVVERHQGRLDFDSSPDGTRFVIEVPAAGPQSQGHSA